LPLLSELESNLQSARRSGNLAALSLALGQIARFCHDSGKLREAVAYWNEDIEVAKRMGNNFGVASNAQMVAGTAEAELGDPAGARAYWEAMYHAALKLNSAEDRDRFVPTYFGFIEREKDRAAGRRVRF